MAQGVSKDRSFPLLINGTKKLKKLAFEKSINGLVILNSVLLSPVIKRRFSIEGVKSS